MDSTEAEAFCSRVDDVCDLIDGLKNGTLDPTQIDPLPNKPTQQVKDTPPTLTPEQQSMAKQRVEDLKLRQQLKEKKREQYEFHCQNVVDSGRCESRTDYRRWELWCPSDEDDDLIRSCTPNQPAFKALEQDMNERHNSLRRQRQVAERCRVAGNNAFKKQQFAEAYRFYSEGLEMQKHDITLHCNAAAASLRMEEYNQAIKHCDKVLDVAKRLLNKPKHPLCIKALLRRAAAHEVLSASWEEDLGTVMQSLGHRREAIADLKAALEIDTTNALVREDLERLQELEELDQRSRKLLKDECEGKISDRKGIQRVRYILQRFQRNLQKRTDTETVRGIVAPLSCQRQANGMQPIEAMLVELQDLAQDERCRLVFYKSDGIPLLLQLMTDSASHSVFVYDVLGVLARDRRILELMLKSDVLLKRFHTSVDSGQATVLHAVVRLCNILAQQRSGRDWLQSGLLSPSSQATEQLVLAACSSKTEEPQTREDIFTLLTYVCNNPVGRKSLCKYPGRVRRVLESIVELIRRIVKQRCSTSLFEKSASLLSILCAEVETVKQIVGSELLPLLISCLETLRTSNAVKGLTTALMLIANCAIHDHIPWIANDNQSLLINNLYRILTDSRLPVEVHSLCLTTVSRITTNPVILNMMRTDENWIHALSQQLNAAMQSETTTETEAKIHDAIFKIFARWTADGIDITESLVKGGVIERCQTLLDEGIVTSRIGNMVLMLANVAKTAMGIQQLNTTSFLNSITNIAAKQSGDISKNAAICLARLSKDPNVLQFLRNNNGMEILYTQLKQGPKSNNYTKNFTAYNR